MPEVLGVLQDAGAAELSAETWQVLRVEVGLPAASAELVSEYTPLEIGLVEAVAAEKGCYTGQEVIARQITYDKITQHLVGLKLESPAEPGGRLYAEDRPVGTLTSAALSPRFGPLGLAVVRRPFHQLGSLLSLGKPEEGGSQPAQVVPLPVSSVSPIS
jgi:folate-binding protein YgfZ